MTNPSEVYRCDVCGNMTAVIHASNGTLVCCGQPMTLLQAKTADAGKEKHVPVVERSANGILVKVGSIPHPMEEKHYIEWIRLESQKTTYIRRLAPGEKPEAEFPITDTGVKVLAYCNVHGLWTNRP